VHSAAGAKSRQEAVRKGYSKGTTRTEEVKQLSEPKKEQGAKKTGMSSSRKRSKQLEEQG